MKLSKVIETLSGTKVQGSPEKEFSGLTFDSRNASQGSMFVAVKGTLVDGHNYIKQAIANGAGIIVCENIPDQLVKEVTYLTVADSRKALGIISSLFYGDPSRELKLIGVTGTNGKTTIATLLYNLHLNLGYKAGLLSTIEVLVNGLRYTSTHTTPDPVQLNYYLREMVDAGCEYCFIEVSSHAVSQDRIAGLTFKGGIFTNLTHEHLDYHADFREYLEAKKAFFDQLERESFALVNKDDKNGTVMIQNSLAESYTYSLKRLADFQGKILEMHMDGSLMTINGDEVWVRLPGIFNAKNILSVYGSAMLCGHTKQEVLKAISELAPVKGRFETIAGRDNKVAVVDYAHSPDALLNVLQTISELNKRGANVITVVGAGGNRDRTKRPKMAQIAVTNSHRVIFTSDNPRDEDPESIINEMVDGLSNKERENSLQIISREEAIKTACMLAQPGDIILVAGKGHETYQEIKGERYPFDDMKIVMSNLK